MIAFLCDAMKFIFSLTRTMHILSELVREAIFDLNRSKYVNAVLHTSAYMERP